MSIYWVFIVCIVLEYYVGYFVFFVSWGDFNNSRGRCFYVYFILKIKENKRKTEVERG